jgi:hypothetical protein
VLRLNENASWAPGKTRRFSGVERKSPLFAASPIQLALEEMGGEATAVADEVDENRSSRNAIR